MAADPAEIKTEIRRYIAENLLFNDKGFPHTDTTSFLNEGIVDSIGVMELVTFVNTRFGVEVDATEITPDNFDSVERLAGFVGRKQAAAGVGASCG